MKTCSKCKEEKSLEDFNKKTSNKDGHERYCKQCHREHNRKHYTNNKQSYIDTARKWQHVKRDWWVAYKQTLSCSHCSESRHWCLDFHHTDPSLKDDTVSQMVVSNRSKGAIMVEVAKCIVVCRNCHADIHYKIDNG